ncbi:RecA-superfamily ATPase implicated in signal transduction, inactivated [Halorhabdus sp. SVX81]|uniref:DUF7125 family protein n=1 Tax=Halorhabdus sp. SVX81 TaxID=2978283 RepID=UPI0023DA1FFF|nr:P-loop NTPase [Halorhabdus sp. SVX81]WEL17701.1 RecA-superfamily ATPase implicated in signal transduction, inactivated [Halorhabdus sp. SVX81]
MLAVAGTKGGCGKTTTAIGIAEGFARADIPAVAIDADRQLPNIHVIGGVDREPTFASLADGDGLSTVSPSPREPTAGLLPAPLPTEDVALESVLDRLANSSVRTVVDCPSGAGPDAVDPLSAADRVIVVTTDTTRSIEGAKATIDMADRLDVPVAGIVLNQCDRVSPSLVEAIDQPILAAIPDRESPLEHPETCEAYDRIASELSNRWAVTNGSPAAADRLTTGIEPLDAALGGGIPHGNVVAVLAEPPSQSEQLLYALTAARGTLYLTVERSRSHIEESIDTAPVTAGNPSIRQLDAPAVLSEANDYVESLPDGANLVIDSMDAFERTDREQFQAFMNGLAEHVRRTESIAFLHCLDSENPPDLRPLTIHFADLVLEFEASMDVTGISQQVTVPKVRGEPLPAETIDLDLVAESVLPTRSPSHGD